MKRGVMIMLVVALASSGFMPAQAEGETPEFVYECLGRAGHRADDNGGYDAWHFNAVLALYTTCRVQSTSDPQPDPPLGLWTARIDLESTSGTLTCGTGELSGTGRAWFTNHRFWTWEGTFVDGEGTITGVAEDNLGPTRTLSGTVVVPAASSPACQDAQPDLEQARNAVAVFTLE